MEVLVKKRIGQILCEKAYLNKSQLDHALTCQKTGKRQPLGEILLERGYITKARLDEALALQRQSLGYVKVNF